MLQQIETFPPPKKEHLLKSQKCAALKLLQQIQLTQKVTSVNVTTTQQNMEMVFFHWHCLISLPVVSLQSSYLFQSAGSAAVPVLLNAVREDADRRGGDEHLWAGMRPSSVHLPLKDGWWSWGSWTRIQKAGFKVQFTVCLIFNGLYLITEAMKLHSDLWKCPMYRGEHLFHTYLVTHAFTCVKWQMKTHTAFGTTVITARIWPIRWVFFFSPFSLWYEEVKDVRVKEEATTAFTAKAEWTQPLYSGLDGPRRILWPVQNCELQWRPRYSTVSPCGLL